MSAEPTSQSTPTLGNSSFSSSKISDRLKQTFAAGGASSASLPPAVTPTDSVPSAPSLATAPLPTPPVATPAELAPESVQATEPVLETVPVQSIEPEPEPVEQLQPEPAMQPAAPQLDPQQLPQDTLNVPHPTAGVSKEAPALQVTVENPVVDAAGGVQYVENAEVAKPPEMPPEVEGFLQTVENNVDQIPQEVVISNPQTGQALPRVLAQPVVILPITPETEKQGRWKSSSHSIRWLIEWSWKMMKVFSGKIIYRKAEVAS